MPALKTIIGTAALYLLSIVLPCHAGTSGASAWQAGKVLTVQEVRKAGADNLFRITEVSDAVFARMRKGGSYPRRCTIHRSDLRYLQLLHYDFSGRIVCGEMVCNKTIANDVREAFRELFNAKYQIERMQLIDDYRASDERSMRANNTSSFCYRTRTGQRRLSRHASGMAIDINPLYNPMVRRNSAGRIIRIQPDTEVSRQYARRSTSLPHTIDRNDLCYKVFRKHGFTWGGAWRHSRDYQHFERR